MNYENLLPLGTIVKLEGADKKVLIIGICPQSDDEEGKKVINDYIGVMYPEGYLNVKMFLIFNREDISEVVFEGYRDGDEWDKFLVMVEGVMNKKE